MEKSTTHVLIVILLFLNYVSFAESAQTEIKESPFFNASRKTITVGGSEADIAGFTSAAIQTAVDALLVHGGGAVKLNPGTFAIMAPVRLYANMELIGSGPETILRKVDGIRTNFVIDADYGEKKLTVTDPSGFVSGMGVQIYDTKQNNAWSVSTAIITAIEDNMIYIDDYLIRDYRADHEGIISNACSVVAAVEAENVQVKNLMIDGNKAKNELINGCRGGGIYLHKVKNALVENVTVKDFNGDGISWQITEDITVIDCEVTGCVRGGLHPGTGSFNILVEGNDIHHNERDGLYICWRVQHGIVKNNKFYNNGRFGICTGHKDTDMIFEKNHIYENGEDGIHFRNESELNAPHRNIFRFNIVENNGIKNSGYGFSFNSPAKDILLEGNIIRNTGTGKQKAAVYIYSNGLPVTLINNKIEGHTHGDLIFENSK
jgi:hypothetical protein